MTKGKIDGAPHPTDLHVGERIRARRRSLGISQETLAEHLGLTFQQVQKYERGANRVSASKLYEISKALNTSISYFFEGLVAGDSKASDNNFDNDMIAFVSKGGGGIVAPFLKMDEARRSLLTRTARDLSKLD